MVQPASSICAPFCISPPVIRILLEALVILPSAFRKAFVKPLEQKTKTNIRAWRDSGVWYLLTQLFPLPSDGVRMIIISADLPAIINNLRLPPT